MCLVVVVHVCVSCLERRGLNIGVPTPGLKVSNASIQGGVATINPTDAALPYPTLVVQDPRNLKLNPRTGAGSRWSPCTTTHPSGTRLVI